MEFAKYLIEPRLFAGLPPDWRWVFGREAPLVVEIGFGNGEFLAEEAANHPEFDYVGFELSLTCIEKAGRKFHAAGLGNVRVVRLDGRFGLRELFADESVREVIVNFPCPWPKARHAERRLVNEGFARTLAAVLEPGGGSSSPPTPCSLPRKPGISSRPPGASRSRGPTRYREGPAPATNASGEARGGLSTGSWPKREPRRK